MCNNYRDCKMSIFAGPLKLRCAQRMSGDGSANTFNKLLRICAVACWTVMMTWLCCADACGQSSINFTTIQYPGLNPVADIRNSMLAAAELLHNGNRLATATASNDGYVNTYLDADLKDITNPTFGPPHFMRAQSLVNTNIMFINAPSQVVIDLTISASNLVSSLADPAQVTTEFTINVFNGQGRSTISPEVNESEVISFPSTILDTSLPTGIQLVINHTLAVDESILPSNYNIDTKAKAHASIDSLQFFDAVDPTKEITFVPSPPVSTFNEGDFLLVSAATAVVTNDPPVETVSAYMGLVDRPRWSSDPLKGLQFTLMALKDSTKVKELVGTITQQQANQEYSRIYRLEARLAEILGGPAPSLESSNRLQTRHMGADPFYGRFTPEQPLSLPFPPQASFRLKQGEGNAGVTIVRPGLWGGGTQDVTVLDSRVTVAHDNGVFHLMDFETRLSPFLVNGVSSGENRGFVPPGGKVWSSVDLAAGEFVAYAEGVIVNDLYPASRPIFVFQDIDGFVNFSRGGEVTAFADNEPMIIPGLPPGPISDRPIAWIATRARFDAATAELRLMENTDNSQLPDVSVVLMPDEVFGLGLDNTAEPLVGASLAVDPLEFLERDAEGTFHFADAAFRVSEGDGTFVSGRLSDVHIDEDELVLLADIALDDPAGTLASQFIEAWRQQGPQGVLLGRLGVIDLLTATNDFTQTGTSQTDFIVLSIDIPEPTLPGDYNQNGVVDAADYVVWRSTVGEIGLGLAADGDGNNKIDAGDYYVWRAHFGSTASAGVPEPSTVLIALAAVLTSQLMCRRQLAVRTLVLLSGFVFGDVALAADVTSTWNNTTGNWSDAARWTPNTFFPNNGNGGFTYDAIINGGTVTLDANVTIEAFNLSGGTLRNAAATNFALTLNNLFTWTGGVLGGPGEINASGGLNLSGSVAKTLGSHFNTGRTLVNNGLTNLSGTGALTIESSGGTNPGSLFQNNGAFNVSGEADISHSDFGGMRGTFANAGAFNKSGAGTTTDINTTFTNTGTVNVDQGTLHLLGGGSSTGGTFDVDAGAALRFSTISYAIDSASLINGAGNVMFTGGTHTLGGAYSITGLTTISGGTVNFNAPSTTLTTLDVPGGALGGSGSQNITTAFNWTAGTLASTGTTTIDNTATLTISGTTNKTLGSHFNTGRTLVNNGLTNLSGDGALTIESSGGPNPGSLFQNNGTFNVSGDADISHSDFGGSPGRFANAGTFNKSGALTTTEITTQFNNTGTVNVNEGTLQVRGGGSSTGGTFDVDAGAALRFSTISYAIDSASLINGAGDVTFSTQTHTLAGVYSITGLTTISGATVNFNTPSTTLTTLDVSSGALGGSGSQNITTAFNWSAGTLASTGTTTIDNTATLTISGSVDKTLGSHFNTGRTLVNNGLANLSGTGALTIESSGGTNPGSLFQNNGTFNVTGDADISHSDWGGPRGGFTNAGAFNKSGTGTTTGINTTFTNTGIVNVNDGLLELSSTFTNYNATTDTLSGGTYNVTSTFRFTNADINTNQASITLNGPASQIVDQSGNNSLADFSTNDTGASFAILNNRNFTTTAAFTNRGQVQIGGGTFNAASVTNAVGGELFGFGTISDAIANSGTVRAAGGTLAMGGIIDGQSGTIQIDPDGSLDLSAASGDSGADNLIHNGSAADSLNLGSNDLLVGLDYNNANFGVGNAFNHRASIAGAGLILADAGVTQTISGNVTGGNTPTTAMNLGNIHVGDSITRHYQINNAGSPMSAHLRGAIQTATNGGNVTDTRLSGSGVTADNFGPLAGSSATGNLAVTFTGTSAGPLVGQQVRVINNFDNVADQLLQLTGTAYRLASASAHSPEPVNFGIVHVGDVLQQALSIGNTAINDGFSERLDATIGSLTGSATTNSGSFTALAPGATNNTSLVVGIDTATAGAKSGTATITLTSNGAGTSGLANTSLAAQTVNVQAQVNNFSVADIVKLSGDGALTMTGANQFAIDLGTIVERQPPLMAELGVMNDALAPADDLAGIFTFAAPDFSLTGFDSFSGVAAGATQEGLLVQLDSSTAGTFAGEIILQPRSTNPQPFSVNLAPITLHVTGEVRLAGDYNQNGVVDAADYVVWRKNDGRPAGYDLWRANFGRTSGSGSGASANAAVPEPLTVTMILFAAALIFGGRERATIRALNLRST
jgi:hypothetical protein